MLLVLEVVGLSVPACRGAGRTAVGPTRAPLFGTAVSAELGAGQVVSVAIGKMISNQLWLEAVEVAVRERKPPGQVDLHLGDGFPLVPNG